MLLYLSVKISVITLRNPETLAVRYFGNNSRPDPSPVQSGPDPMRVQSSSGTASRRRRAPSAPWRSRAGVKRPFQTLEQIRSDRTPDVRRIFAFLVNPIAFRADTLSDSLSLSLFSVGGFP